MKIGYIRYNYITELDYYNASASTLGTDLRVPIISTLLSLGHDVSIYSYLGEKDKKIIESGEGAGPFDYKQFKKINVKEGERADDDLVIVEQATPVSIITDKHKKPLIGYCADALRGYKGKVLWYHHGEMKCPVPLFWNNKPVDTSVSPANMRNLFHDMGVKKEQVGVWSHTPNPKALLKHNKQLAGLTIYPTPMGYDPKIEPQRDPVEDSEYDFMYIGANKENRKEKLVSFFSNIPYSVCIIGKGFPDASRGNITFKPQIKGHGRLYDLYRNAKASLIIGNPEFEQTGNQTTRFTQPINSGLLTFGDKRYYGLGSVVGANQLVMNKINLVGRYAQIEESGNRGEIVKQQQGNLKPWTKILSNLLDKINGVS